MVVLSKLSHLRGDNGKGWKAPTNTGKEKKENTNLQGWDLRGGYVSCQEGIYIYIYISIYIYTLEFKTI